MIEGRKTDVQAQSQIDTNRIRRLSLFCLSAMLMITALFWPIPLKFAYQKNDVVKILLGPKKIPFCMPSEYVSGVGQLTDGTWRMDATMFLPNFLPESVYDKLYPIPTSPVFQSPERIQFENSILQIEVKSSYQGTDDPTGELSQKEGIENSEKFDVPSISNPVFGFTEYDDKYGNAEFYGPSGAQHYDIVCFGRSCDITEIFKHAFLIDIALNRPAISRSLDILTRINKIIELAKCRN